MSETESMTEQKVDSILSKTESLSLFQVKKAFAPAVIRLLDEVRAMCETNRCGMYNANWACPPGCGELKDIEVRIRTFGNGVIVQTVAQLEDDFDIEGMEQAGEDHKINFAKLVEEMAKDSDISEMMPLGAGTCTLCAKCAYPDEPCRQPEKAYSSLEAAGIQVSDLCTDSGIPYYHGRGTLAYTSAVLFNPTEN